MVSIISLILFFTLEERQESDLQVEKVYEQLKFKTLLKNDVLSFNGTWISGM